MYPNRVHSGASVVVVLAALITFGWFGAPVAHADELTIRPRVQLFEEWSTNPTREQDRDLADASATFRYKPSLEIESRGATGYTNFHFGVNGRKYHDSDLDELDANDRFADFEFERSVTKRLAFFGSAGYLFSQSVDAIFIDNGTPTIGDGLLLVQERPDIETLSGQFGLRYMLNQRSSVRLSAFLYDFDFDLPGTTTDPFDPFRNRRDFKSDVVSLSYNRVLSPRDSGFLQVSYRLTKFDEAASIFGPFQDPPRPNGDIPFGLRSAPTSPEQDDKQTSVIAGWNRQWTPELGTSLSGGTRFLRTERKFFQFFNPFQGVFNGVLPSKGESTAFVGSASLTRTFKRGQLELFASKETRPSSSISASIDETTYGFKYTHRFSRKLSATFRLRNEYREAANEGGFDDTARTRRYDGTVSWRLRERWVAFATVSSTKSDADEVFFNSFSDYRVSSGFRYAFDLDELNPF